MGLGEDKKPPFSEEGWSPGQLATYFALAQVGAEMVMPLVLGLFLDHYLNWTPWGMIVGAVLGPVLGLVHLVAILNRSSDGQGKKNRDKPC